MNKEMKRIRKEAIHDLIQSTVLTVMERDSVKRQNERTIMVFQPRLEPATFRIYVKSVTALANVHGVHMTTSLDFITGTLQLYLWFPSGDCQQLRTPPLNGMYTG